MRSGVIVLLFVVFGSVVLGIGGDMGVGTNPNTNGSLQYPYLIEDLSDFQVFRSNNSYWASGVHTKLMCDIDLDPSLEGRGIFATAIIAKDTSTISGFQGTVFNGIFDGNDHIIDNMTIEIAEADKDYLGLFGKIDSYGEVHRLDVMNVSIQGGGSSGYSFYVGGLCGANFGIITDCHVTGSISGYSRIGGLCGWNSGKGENEDFYEGIIKNSSAHCSVTAFVALGGLCGLNANIGVIEDSYATGTVTGGDYSNELGGLCGRNGSGFNYGFISNCFAAVSVTGGDNCESLGGLCGYNNYSSIEDSYATGEVKGGDNSSCLGGLCGYADEGSIITECYSIGSITGEDYIGGFCGYNLYGTYINCFWDIETSGITKGVGYISAETGTVLGKTTSQMQMQNTFLDAEWEFADFQVGLRGWYMPENSYPKLDWQNSNAKAVPYVGGYLFSEAQSKLGETGLTVGEMIDVKSWKTLSGTVAGISVHAGGYVDESFPIDIFVSSGFNGDGSEDNPYEIAGKDDLEAINTSLSSCYIMTADIYLGYDVYYNNAVIAPPYAADFHNFIGTPFSGTFNGGGHIISKLVIYPSYAYNGLFGYIDQDGIVINLGIRNSQIVSGHDCFGILCGGNSGHIDSCYVVDSIVNGSNVSYAFGGMCGENWGGVIGNCYFTGKVIGRSYADVLGGFCGFNFQGSIHNCYSTGVVTGEYDPDSLGGFCGINHQGYFNNCFWDIDTSGVIDGVGNEIPDPNNVTGKTTAEMQALLTFTNASWDFVGESTNGFNDIWRMCIDGIEYPRLSWEFAKNGDFACGDGTDIYDLQALAEHWLLTEEFDSATFSYACDANGDGVIDLIDFSVLGKNW